MPLVPMDYVLIKRVLVILIDNALKYSERDLAIDISTSVASNYARVHIEDRGPGIPSEDMYRVFDKFYRVPGSRSTPGLGLGLSIARGLARTHGGDVTLINRQGGGATAVVYLPLMQEPEEDFHA
jgi:two-component system sensor histidine kinase KdpD